MFAQLIEHYTAFFPYKTQPACFDASSNNFFFILMVNNGPQEECQFFYKVGACRHGNKCVRKHTVPQKSKAIVLVSMPLPDWSERGGSNEAVQDVIRDIFIEVALIAPIQEIFVAANSSPHLKGAVYISFASESEAAKVLTNINSRWFNGRPVFAHYLPSQLLSMAVCRDGDRCQRKLDCNYAHPMQLDPGFWAELFAAQANEYASRETERNNAVIV